MQNPDGGTEKKNGDQGEKGCGAEGGGEKENRNHPGNQTEQEYDLERLATPRFGVHEVGSASQALAADPAGIIAGSALGCAGDVDRCGGRNHRLVLGGSPHQGVFRHVVDKHRENDGGGTEHHADNGQTSHLNLHFGSHAQQITPKEAIRQKK